MIPSPEIAKTGAAITYVQRIMASSCLDPRTTPGGQALRAYEPPVRVASPTTGENSVLRSQCAGTEYRGGAWGQRHADFP
ncbi:hypothetical protein MDUV_29520 [Mycolicibacterium duvalii]|uniref:Uncharacterized protein n=1 Tax=Mycolicibacterium duvalii TaxID=39688 RepID=A0A7I7K3Y5_9MYCO|nr:hypothetical protein MDUV_29520 [Mycolicibacterium duvalii]